MEVIPAVDVMKGKVVRLLKGDPRFVKSYEHLGDPVTLAEKWESEGARIIHIIDLDAALELGSNIEVIKGILKAVKASLQVGGGIRNLHTARALLNLGVERILLGSLAFEKPSSVRALLDEFGDSRVVIALDNLNGVIMVHGWKTSAKIAVGEAVSKFSRMGVRLFLVTSVERDGTMAGPDLEILNTVRRLGVDVIAAGGISSLKDIAALKSLGVHGVVVGKALYEGLFSLREALKIAQDH